MKIVTDYWDYYDYLQAYAGETQDVYIRNRKEEKHYDHRMNLGSGCSASTNIETVDIPRSSYSTFEVTIIGFCGKLYPVIVRRLRDKNDENGRWYGKYIENDLDYELDDRYEATYDVEKIISLGSGYYAKDHTNYINQLVTSKVLNAIFLEKEVPIFVARKIIGKDIKYHTFEINYAPILSRYQFDKVFDAQSAFQEIEWYFANVIYNRENHDPQITDNIVLRDAKGFDKMSFKNGKKKRSR